MFFLCAMGNDSGKLKSTERVFDEYSVEKNALRCYAATYSKLEEVQKKDSPWAPVFEGHLLKSAYANSAELKILIENTNDMQWVSISGTETPEVTLVDCDLDTSNEFGIRMHKGVLKVARDIHDTILPFLEKTKAIRITGHSIGGAAATAIAYRLTKGGYSIEQCVSFGAPKFTDESGARKVSRADVPLLRVTTAEDAVPTLAPSKLDVGWFIFSKHYAHAGPELYLGGSGGMSFSEEPRAEDKADADKAEQTWANVTWLAQAEESRMKAYLHAMKPATDVKVHFYEIVSAVSELPTPDRTK